ncbi:histidinol-phosphate aminotransferase family protein [Candidatus Woesearchaeota archaeon]|nr:histidinol-phosphate aminotransferase family protein [Candidatus Woesearchaeota archaeon]
MNQKKVVRKNILNLETINWGETPKEYLILKWGENLYPPSENVVNAISKAARKINIYPDPLKKELTDELSKYTGLDKKNILVTNGADKAFRLIAETFIEKEDNAITFVPSYPVFDSAVEIMDGNLVFIELDKNFKIDLQKVIAQINSKTKLIYLCNPNNPTSNFIINKNQLIKILDQEIIVVLDEAYYEFSRITYSDLVNKFPNLIILRSFSKGFGLAGLRVGYILANAGLIEYMKKIEDNIEIFNVPTTSLAGATEALRDIDYIESNINKIESTKLSFYNLFNQEGIAYIESKTSFLFFNIKDTCLSSKEFVQGMKDKRILLKDCSIYKNLNDYWVYMAVPPQKDTEFVIKSIKTLLYSKESGLK